MSLTDAAFDVEAIQQQFGLTMAPRSLVVRDGLALWLDRANGMRRLAVLASPGEACLDEFEGTAEAGPEGAALKWCALTHANAYALRETIAWLKPQPLGLATSAGFGDRLGMATPGHVLALERVLGETPGATLLPIFAQQSIRENTRTGRTPDDVLADATWGTFEAGWRGGVGADADHLKTVEDVDACARAGFSFYTIDPGAYVDNEADTDAPSVIQQKVDALPWDTLESSAADLVRRYSGQRVVLEDRTITLDTESIQRAAAKYARAIAHVAAMYGRVVSHSIPFELEVSVDETETPTTHAEHVYFVSELQRLGVQWVSLAPRFVGRFEKGVDYIGDLGALQVDLDGHAAIARAFGSYKLSLHSGSDKFSVYPLIVAATRGIVHLKTAGTSYLEALRVLTHVNTGLFREILAFGRQRYDEDRASYHVSADVARVPAPESLSDAQLPALLEDFDAREVLHVTFGSALGQFEAPLKETLRDHQDVYNQTLERHFYRHLKPFVA